MALESVANIQNTPIDAYNNARLGVEGFESLAAIFCAITAAASDVRKPDVEQIKTLAKLGRSIALDYENILDCAAEQAEPFIRRN